MTPLLACSFDYLIEKLETACSLQVLFSIEVARAEMNAIIARDIKNPSSQPYIFIPVCTCKHNLHVN